MKFKWQHLLMAVGLVVLIVMVVDFNRRLGELDRLTAQQGTVRAQGTAVMQTQNALMTQLTYANSTQAVEDWAYQDGHWIRPDEKPIGILPAGNVTPTSILAPVATDQAQPNWRIWWELFFGKSNP
jgi:hypothetical protein